MIKKQSNIIRSAGLDVPQTKLATKQKITQLPKNQIPKYLPKNTNNIYI